MRDVGLWYTMQRCTGTLNQQSAVLEIEHGNIDLDKVKLCFHFKQKPIFDEITEINTNTLNFFLNN